MDIKAGDIVRLKGSEIEMVVSHLNEEKTHCRVYWMSSVNGDVSIKSDGVPLVVLELISKADDASTFS